MTDNNISDKQVNIAVDAMGGDFGIEVNVAGALKAMDANDKIAVTLIGDKDAIAQELAKRGAATNSKIAVTHSDSVIQEGERPFRALSEKPTASIFVAAQQVQEGAADAFISAGSTGATYVAANLAFGPLPGLERGMVCGNIFGFALDTFLLDLGALVDVSPRHLVKLGVLGIALAKWHGTPNPRVALLNIGAEDGKGNRQVKAAAEMLKKSSLNYIGSIEPQGLLRGDAEVVICDGFVGNIVLKLTEALGNAAKDFLLKNFGHLDEIETLTSELHKQTNRSLIAGAAPIVGLNGVALVAHGASSADTIANGISSAYKAVVYDLPGGQKRLLETLILPGETDGNANGKD